MATFASSNNDVLALYPPRVLGATQPVVDAHIGVSLVIYDLLIDGKGAIVQVDPQLSGTVNPGDLIKLWLVGDTTFLDSVIIEDVDAITPLRIPKGRLHPDRINELFYTITRGSQNIGTSEPLLTLLYNKIRPGLKDTKPEVDGHSELELLLPDSIRNGVGADFVSAQVCVSYPYCRAYDTITLKCNGEIMTYKVGKDEAPQPPNPGSAIPTTVCFTVTRAYLESAKRPSEKLDFSYTVTDQLGNTPDTDAVWSASQTVDEDLAGTRLSAPILLERMEDFPGDDATLIELDKLAGGPLLVIVVTADNRFLPGDTVEATYTAKVSGQPVDVVVPVSGVVEADSFGQKKPCILKVTNDKVIAKSLVTAAYTLERGDTVIASSKTATAQVIGEGVIKLNPATLVAPAVSPIDLWLYPTGVTVRIEFLAAVAGDKARLIEINPAPGATPFPAVEFNANKRTNTVLTQAFLAERHGTQLEFRWALIRGGKEIARSGPLVLSVKRIADGDARFPTPVVAGQTGQELDVTKLVAGDKLSIAPWPLQVAGHYVWLRYDGFNSNGARIFFDDLKGVPHNEAQGLTRPVLVDWLNTLKHGTAVTITFRVNFYGVANEAGATIFPIASYIIKSFLHTLYETFESSPLGVIPIGSSMQLLHMKITPVRGRAMIRNPTVHYPPYTAGRTLLGDLNFSIKIELQQGAKNIKFALGDTDRVPCLISYFDEQDKVLVIRNSPPFGSQITVWEQYIPPVPRRIKTIIIEGTDADLDNFTMNF
jgi:hypothetical protein